MDYMPRENYYSMGSNQSSNRKTSEERGNKTYQDDSKTGTGPTNMKTKTLNDKTNTGQKESNATQNDKITKNRDYRQGNPHNKLRNNTVKDRNDNKTTEKAAYKGVRSPRGDAPKNKSTASTNPSKNIRKNSREGLPDISEHNYVNSRERSPPGHQLQVEDFTSPEDERREVLERSSRRMNQYEPESDDEDFRSSRTSRGQNIEREKFETHLRSSRVPETKVRGLALRLSQVHGTESETPRNIDGQRTERILRKIILNGLDPMVNGSRKRTNLDNFENDTEGLAEKVSELVHQLKADLDDSKTSLNIIEEDDDNNRASNQKTKQSNKQTNPNKKVKGQGTKRSSQDKKGTSRQSNKKQDDSTRQEIHMKAGKPATVVVQEGIRELQTQYDILQDKYQQLQKEKEQLLQEASESQDQMEEMGQQKRLLEEDLRKLAQETDYLDGTLGKIKSDEIRLRSTLTSVNEERKELLNQKMATVSTLKSLTRELNSLQDENMQLLEENKSLRSEVKRLKQPDKQMAAKIQQLNQEVKELRTQTRKLEGEKGTLKTGYLKIESALEALQTERKDLVKHRETLLKEKKQLEGINKKLTFSGPNFG